MLAVHIKLDEIRSTNEAASKRIISVEDLSEGELQKRLVAQVVGRAARSDD